MTTSRRPSVPVENRRSRRIRKDKSFLTRVRTVLLWNLAIAAAVGAVFWWATSHGAPQMIWAYFKISLVYANVYGFLLGLSMPYLGQRLAALRSPWKWIAMVLTLMALTALGALIIGVIFVRIRFYRPGEFWPAFTWNFLIGSVVSLIIGLSIGFYEGIRNKVEQTALQLRVQELEKERALKLASEAQLASLASRLHPHFLFNTLNSISALIREDPNRAEHMMQRLSELLRFSLDSAVHPLVPLSSELKIVGDYLEIEKERFGQRLSYTLDVPDGAENLMVPPLSVQTLVENSVKYAVAPFREGGTIHVTARSEQDSLVLQVWDSGPGFLPDSIPAGRGLANLQERLTTLFGDSGSISVRKQEKLFAVTVSLPKTSRKEADPR